MASVVNPGLISVGYRPAPKHPLPEDSKDGYDAAECLFDNPKARCGVPLKLAAGEVILPTCTTLSLKSANLMKSVGPTSRCSPLFSS